MYCNNKVLLLVMNLITNCIHYKHFGLKVCISWKIISLLYSIIIFVDRVNVCMRVCMHVRTCMHVCMYVCMNVSDAPIIRSTIISADILQSNWESNIG